MVVLQFLIRLSVCLTIPPLAGQFVGPNPGNGGKIELIAPEPAGHYRILERSRDLQNWRPVSANSTGPLADTVLPGPSGFYRVRFIPTAAPLDSDGDGRDDWSELTAGNGAGLLFNAADPIDPTHGATSLPTEAKFDELAHRDNFPGAQNVREVKFLITDLKTHPQLYFINMNTYPHHYNFARGALGRYTQYSFYNGNSIFSGETYFGNSNRKNLAGSLVSHENFLAPDGTRGLYTMEFWPTDPVEFRFVETAYEMIAAGAPFIDRLVYHPPSETQRQLLAAEKDLYDASFVHTIETETLFSNVDYQPMHLRSAFGRLTEATGTVTLSARDIVIFKNLPNDLTHIAGIITEVPQTPLSHVNLKARQNDTPNAFIKNASADPRIAPFLGKNVFYEVGPSEFTLRLATQTEVDDYFESIRPTFESDPPRDLTKTVIKPLSEIPFSESNAFGGKAANLAELGRISSVNAPDGFAIPFYFYDEFMKHNGLYAEATAMMAEPQFQSDPAYREERLRDFRKKIKKQTTLPGWMHQALTTLQGSFPVGVTPRLRSSANAEDSVEFNGAGLYDSYTHHDDEGHISKSVKQVWASLWNYRAYEEREFYRINHLTSAMGILVHPNSSDEQANGVAVARNIFDPNWEGYYLNVQIGEDLVTNPGSDSIPEEMLVADLLGENRYEIQYIRFSNQIPVGEKVLTRDQVLALVAQMRTINSRFRSLYAPVPSDFAMEIEFKVSSGGELLVKQARPWVN